MPFVKKTRVGYYDCDLRDRLKLSAAMQYMQQTSSEHLESLGISTERLFAEKLVFLLVKSCLKVHRMPRVNERLHVLTAPVATKGVRFVREFAVDTPEGERLISACTLWVLADTEQHRVLRPKHFPYPLELHPSFLEGAVGDEPLLREPLDEPMVGTRRTIRYSHLDCNNHVNNCIYADFLMDALPIETVTSQEIDRLVLHFQHEATHGQEITTKSYKIEKNGNYINGLADGHACFEANLFFR